MQVIIGLIQRFRDERKAGRTATLVLFVPYAVQTLDNDVLGNLLTPSGEALAAAGVAFAVDWAWKKVRPTTGVDAQ